MKKMEKNGSLSCNSSMAKNGRNMPNPTCQNGNGILVLLLFACFLFPPLYMSAQVTISLDYSEKNSLTSVQSGDLYTMQLDYSVSSTTGNATGVTAVINLPDNIYGLANYVGTVHAPISNFVFDDTPGAKKLTITFVSPLASGSTGVLEFGIRTNNLTTLNGTVLTTNAEITANGGYSSGVSTHNMTVTAIPRICGEKTLLGGGALDNVTTYRIQVYAGGYSNQVPLGTLQATNISLKDTLPAGAQFVSAQIYDLSGNLVGNGTNSGGIVTAAIPDLSFYVLGRSQLYYVDIAVQFNTPTFGNGDVVTNKAAVIYTPYGGAQDTLIHNENIGGGCTSDLIETLTLALPVASVNFANNSNCGNVYPNNRFEYYMGFSNTGNIGLDNVEIIDSIPANIRIDATASYRGVRFDAMNYLNHVEYQTNLSGGTWISHTPPNGYEVVPLLPSGEYFTKLKFVLNSPLAAGTVLPGYHVLTFVPASVPVAPETVTNCMYWTSTTAGIPTLAARTICNTCYTLQPRPSTAKVFYQVSNSPSCGSNLAIGQNITFLGTVVADIGHSDTENPIAVMFIPSGYQFVSQSFNALTSGIGTAPTLQIIPNYITRGGVVKNLYRWTFPSGTNLPYGTQFSVSATVKVTAALQVGTNYITDFLATGTNVTAYQPENVWAGSITDASDLDSDLNVVEQFPITTNDYCCWACKVSSSASMESIKWVKGQCDSTYSRYPDYGQTMPGGKADYRLVVKNTGNVPMKDIKIIDILPFVGDRGVIDPSPRLSEWRPNLAGPIAAPSGITVYYSTVSNPCRDEVKQPTDPSPFPTGCTTPNWTNIPPEDITLVRSVKIDFGATILAGGDSLILLWPMRAPADAPTSNEVAWNSFGYVATRTDNNQPLIAAEPIKVGIKLKPLAPAIYGDFVWLDSDQDGIQDAGETGVSGVHIDIYKDNGNGIAEPNVDLLYDFTITDSLGRYLFPTLYPGDYFAVFSPLAGYTVSPTDQGGNDALDSDGLITPITRLGASEDDRSWDLGIHLASPCDLNITNYTISDCDWNGTASEVTVNVFVTWKNAPVGENINVTLNGVTQTINVAAAPTSQGLVSFMMNPNDTDYTITANFATTNTCSDNQLIHLPLACPPITCDLNIVQVNVGACDNGNVALDIKVAWEGAPVGENIVITAAGQSKTINVKDMVESPVIVYFSVAGNGTTNNPITASFTTSLACSDNATFNLPLCKGSVGNYVWNDDDKDGNQDAGELGINGVTVELWNNGTNSLISSTTTTNDINGNAGYYNFVVLLNDNYYVKFPTSYNGLILTTQTTTAATDGNSDANTSTGISPIFALNPDAMSGVLKDNPTIDAGFKCDLTAAIAKSNDLSCPTPTATLTASPATGVSYLWDNGSTSATRVVSAAGTYSVTVTDTANGCSAAANITVTSIISIPPCTPVTIQKTK
jgi:hypothetical protein